MKKAFRTYFVLFILTLFSGFVNVYGNSTSRVSSFYANSECIELAAQNSPDSRFLPSSSSDSPFLSKFIVTETDSEELVDNRGNDHEDLFTSDFYPAFYIWYYNNLFQKKSNTVSGRSFIPELQYPKQYIRFQVFRI
ncbi:hypothetical protein ACH3PA_13160 [Leeuwenhoekiella sp. A2]|uniref:hypothetical protein n=1 Tax=Leeuwenhoekiella sp. A2 TaxID=3141460 RepID=UPI003A7F9E25